MKQVIEYLKKANKVSMADLSITVCIPTKEHGLPINMCRYDMLFKMESSHRDVPVYKAHKRYVFDALAGMLMEERDWEWEDVFNIAEYALDQENMRPTDEIDIVLHAIERVEREEDERPLTLADIDMNAPW